MLAYLTKEEAYVVPPLSIAMLYLTTAVLPGTTICSDKMVSINKCAFAVVHPSLMYEKLIHCS